MDADTRRLLEVTRRQLKATQKSLRTSLQLVADLEERLANAQPEGGHSNGTKRSRDYTRTPA